MDLDVEVVHFPGREKIGNESKDGEYHPGDAHDLKDLAHAYLQREDSTVRWVRKRHSTIKLRK
jgi:hypothetical protein